MGVGLLAAAPAHASFWSSSTVPANPDATDDSSSVTLGLQFYADVAGDVVAVRFYKGQYNTGAHSGQLWSASGTLLGSVNFTNESASGWQQATFSTPIAIQAKTTYVISYMAQNGNYADDQNYNWGGLNATPLHVSGSAPGVYSYNWQPSFPNQSWNSSNYYVDVVFVPKASSTTYSISGKVSGAGATISLSGAASASAKTDSSGNYSFTGLANGSYLLSPVASGYVFSPATATTKVNGANVTGVNFTASKPASHSVTLSWAASTSPNIIGYKVYRSGSSGGPYTLMVSSPLSGTSYVDSNVTAGDTYYYVTTAISSSGLESAYSNQASAVVP